MQVERLRSRGAVHVRATRRSLDGATLPGGGYAISQKVVGVDKQTYLFRHPFTGVIKAYKKITPVQAETANTLLVQAAGDCRWYVDPLPTVIPRSETFKKIQTSCAEVVDGRR